jgi:phage-related protein
MTREFVPFDENVIDQEFEALRKSSSLDLAKLLFCIQRFEQVSPKDDPSPAFIQSFDAGFLELRHKKGEYKGRLLFYAPKAASGTEELVILVVFRKETQKTPNAMIKLAIKRMKQDLERRQTEEKQK